MRKWMYAGVCAALAAGMLAGCGSKESGSAASAQATAQGSTAKAGEEAKSTGDDVTISYACWDSNQGELLRTVAKEFEKENPHIKVDIQINSWDNYWTALEAAATGGALPDTFWMHSNNIYYYGANDQLKDLTPYIEKSGKVKLSDYPEGLVKIYNIKGKQYAVPKDYDTVALWYNKTLFDQTGIAYPDDTWTWKDLKDGARKLTKPDKSQYGFCAPLINQEGYYNFVYENGGEIITKDGKSGYDEPATIAGIEEYFSYVKEGLSPEIYGGKEPVEAVENGLCAMGLFGSWNLSGFAASDYMKQNFDCTVLPMSNEGVKSTIFNGLGNAMSASCKHPDEAWRWIEYLSSREGQLRQAELGVAISAYNGTAAAFAKALPAFNTKCYIDMVDYAQIRPFSNHTSVWEDKAYELLKNAYGGREDTATACGNVADMMNQALAAEQ